MTPVNSVPWSFYERHFSADRLHHYVAECKNDLVAARSLYDWNTKISAAFWESLGTLEVAFRNAIDRAMCMQHSGAGEPGHWIFDNDGRLGRDAGGPDKHRQPFLDIAMATRRVRTNHMVVTPGQIISELPFGFWHQMVSKRQLFLWPDLAASFPHTPSRGQHHVRDPVARLRELRNRIGHHHRVWSRDVSARYEDVISVAGFIDPDLSEWIQRRSRVPALLAQRP